MKYDDVVRGIFLDRPNRFVAHVEIGGKEETVHVKNTGRCRELLLPGVEVALQRADSPGRKTAYDLISVFKPSLGWVNIDSQAPNAVVREWLSERDFDLVKPEYRFGDSRIDFYMEKGEERYLLEIKGCTLEIGGTGFFPDAPTLRGVKHLRELAEACRQGYRCGVGFVIAMEGVDEVRPNVETHPEFGKALDEASDAGVEILFMTCSVTPDSLKINDVKARRGSV